MNALTQYLPDPEPPRRATLSRTPESVVMNALNRYLPGAYDAVRSTRRALRFPSQHANPFGAMASVLGLGEPLGMVEGPARAVGPLVRGGKEIAERIAAPAIATKDGRYFTGALHILAAEAAKAAGAFGSKAPGAVGYMDGYWTTAGRFVDRAEGARIAKASKQPNIRTGESLDALDISDRVSVEPAEVFAPRNALVDLASPKEAAEQALRFARPAREIVSEPGYVYHATNLDNAREISRSGIRTHRPNAFTDQDVWPDGSVERRSYYSRNAGATEAFAPEHGEPVLLRVREIPKAFRAERGTGDIYATKGIPAGVLEILTEGGEWKKLREAFK